MEITAARVLVALPIKTEEHIIESLDEYHDAGTIATCALVCRRWLPISRSKLYRRVNLHYLRQWLSFENIVLRPSSPEITLYLKKVEVLYVHPRDGKPIDEKTKRSHIGRKSDQERPWAHLILPQCTACLTGLKTISYTGVDLTTCGDLELLCGSYYPCVTFLGLDGCHFDDGFHMLQFLSGFPSLSTLSMRTTSLRSSSE